MGDAADMMVAQFEPERRGRSVRGGKRRAEATTEFDEACQLARANGLRLRCCSDAHYQLKHVCKDWLLNIYPGNRRLYHDPQRMGPFLRVPDDWTLIDIVRAAVKLERGAEVKR